MLTVDMLTLVTW